MPKILLTLPPELHAAATKAAKDKYETLSVWTRGAMVAALTKLPAAKPLSIREEKEAARAALNERHKARFRQLLADGATSAGILTSCQSWHKDAAILLGQVLAEDGGKPIALADMPLSGASVSEQDAILAARKAAFDASMDKWNDVDLSEEALNADDQDTNNGE